MFDAHPDAGVAHGDAIIIDADGRETGTWTARQFGRRALLDMLFFGGNHIISPTAAVRRAAYDACGTLRAGAADRGRHRLLAARRRDLPLPPHRRRPRRAAAPPRCQLQRRVAARPRAGAGRSRRCAARSARYSLRDLARRRRLGRAAAARRRAPRAPRAVGALRRTRPAEPGGRAARRRRPTEPAHGRPRQPRAHRADVVRLQRPRRRHAWCRASPAVRSPPAAGT